MGQTSMPPPTANDRQLKTQHLRAHQNQQAAALQRLPSISAYQLHQCLGQCWPVLSQPSRAASSKGQKEPQIEPRSYAKVVPAALEKGTEHVGEPAMTAMGWL